MLKDLMWFTYSECLETELIQACEEGKYVEDLKEKVKAILSLDRENPEKELQAVAILDEVRKRPVEANYNYVEPNDLEGIANERKPKNKPCISFEFDKEKLYDKVYGAWLGRSAGCMLGKPVECWYRDKIEGFLKDTGNYPINYYMSSDVSQAVIDKYQIDPKAKSWINNLSCMPVDDDMNYTVLGLLLLEDRGVDFTTDDVAINWISKLPLLHVCTAERYAYKNIAMGVFPPETAVFRNAYREWIGAQIRGDFFGYITPGNTLMAADLAYRDAALSHVKNGIYGEMLIAAMLSASACMNDIHEIIDAGLSTIPHRSRLYEKIDELKVWHKSGMELAKVIDKIHELYDEKTGHGWCHTISNAMVVCASLLYGELDFGKSITTSVMAGFDTDCNGATVGSIVGMILGAKALPQKWVSPLNDELETSIVGTGTVKLSKLAERTVGIIEKHREKLLIK